MVDVVATNETIVVVGGGISGMTAAVEAAETGKNVILLERTPSLGGRVSQLYKYFPKLCHPTCGMEINLRRLRANKRIKVLTLAEVQKVDGQAGDYRVTVRLHPRFVNENCTACGACGEVVSAQIDNPFDYGMSKMKAAYLPFANVAFIQCAGSRDRNHLKHCSRDQGHRRTGRVFREATHPAFGLRERRLSRARYGGHESVNVERFRAHYPGSLLGFGQHDLDNRRLKQRLRRRDDDGLQARR